MSSKIGSYWLKATLLPRKGCGSVNRMGAALHDTTWGGDEEGWTPEGTDVL